jgi:hypothetical protein
MYIMTINVYRYTSPYTHSVRQMLCGIGIPHVVVNDLDEIWNERNRLLCWRGRLVMETSGLVGQLLGEPTRSVQHPMPIGIGSVRSCRGRFGRVKGQIGLSNVHPFEGPCASNP